MLKRKRHLPRLLACIFMLLCSCGPAYGTETAAGNLSLDAPTEGRSKRPESHSEFVWGNGVSGPICGPFAACAAMRRLGADVSPKSFVTAKYIGTCEGTTQEQLVTVIEDTGYSAYPADTLSILDLAIVDLPFIALVRPSPASNRYSHWVTVERCDGSFMVLDSGKEPYELSPAEFMGLWSGAGVFVGRGESSSPLTDIFLLRLALLLTALGFGFTIFRVGTRLLRDVGWLAETALLVGLSVAICAGALWLFGDLKNRSLGVQIAVAPYTGDFVPMSIDDAVIRSREQGSLLIDARREVDFIADAIEGAVNVPVYAAREDVRRFMHDIDKDTNLYIYCQSATCDYDDTIGRLMASSGFENIYICNEGIFEYRESTRQVETNE